MKNRTRLQRKRRRRLWCAALAALILALALSLGLTARLWYDIEAHPVTYHGPVEGLYLPEDFDAEAYAWASYRYDVEHGLIIPPEKRPRT